MKSFTATKFREGYDPDEVDDFLDEVIGTIGYLQNENTELKAKLEETQNKLAAFENGKGAENAATYQADNSRVNELEAELEKAHGHIAALEAAAAIKREVVEPRVDNSLIDSLRAELERARDRINELEMQARSGSVYAEAPATGTQSVIDNPESASAMLALAQRVHDEYVRDGQAEAARLREEAKAQCSQLVVEAEAKRNQLIRDAETKRDRLLAELEAKRYELQARIDELKNFEKDYRAGLRAHLEDILGRLGSTEE